MAFRLPTNGLEDSSVTDLKIAGNVQKFPTYNAVPLNDDVSLVAANANSYVYLGHTGTPSDNYTVTLPAANTVEDGEWFTFVATDVFDTNEQSFRTNNAVELNVSINGVINGISTNSIKINEANSTITVVSYADEWFVSNVSPALTANTGATVNPQDAIAKREFAGFASYSGTQTINLESNSFVIAEDNNVTFVLPPNPTFGDRVAIGLEGNNTTDVLVQRNGNVINGLAEDMTIDIPWVTATFRWVGNQWRIS